MSNAVIVIKDRGKAGHPIQTHCKRGHAYSEHGRRNHDWKKAGYQICLKCRREARQRRDGFDKHVGKMERLLREGMMLSSNVRLLDWQRQVFSFFESIENKKPLTEKEIANEGV